MDESSLRVDGLGNAVIFDVISQTSVLHDFSKSLTAKDVNPAQLVEFMGILQEKGTDLEERVEKTEQRLAEVERESARERNGQVPSEEAQKLATEVTVVVLAEQAGHAELTVKYVVSNADWEPLYDLRATVDSNSKSQNTTSISLNYRASITQTTGEDWKDVNLVLSTSSPLTGTDIPVLSPQRIGAVRTVTFRSSAKKRARKMAVPGAAPMASLSMERSMSYGGGGGDDEDEEVYYDAPPRLMSARKTEAREGAISTSFHIDGLSNIPSDNSAHKVAIGVLDLSAKMEWVTVPRLVTSAFLQCQITNTSTYVLLSGASNVFLDGSFVAKSTIPYVSPQDNFSCSVGVDPSVRITYPPVSKKARTQATGSFLNSSKQDVTLFTQRISLKNTRQSDVKLLVRDLVPVSEEQKFRIALLEPKGLGEAKTGEEVKLSADALCYWARKDWDTSDKSTIGPNGASKTLHKSSQNDVPDGQIEWVVALGPGKSRELTLSWEMTAPQGEKWETH